MAAARELRIVHGTTVHGIAVDGATRCAHYHGPLDVIALRFACCGEFFPCFDCHHALSDHPPRRWPAADFDREAVLCGICGHRLAIHAYLTSGNRCPQCGAGFNPGCARHHHLYFEMPRPAQA